MTMFAQPLRPGGATPVDELVALSWLERTPNAIRLRIAGLAPDQLYRGTTDQLSIAEEIALTADRERAYLGAFREALTDEDPHLEEPQPGPGLLDREFAEDLANFFDLRRHSLDLLRTLNEEWDYTVTLPGGNEATLRELAIRLAQLDRRMLETISDQRKIFLRTTGVDELRDAGVAGKLGPNIGQ
jgi:hypothetical protein